MQVISTQGSAGWRHRGWLSVLVDLSIPIHLDQHEISSHLISTLGKMIIYLYSGFCLFSLSFFSFPFFFFSPSFPPPDFLPSPSPSQSPCRFGWRLASPDKEKQIIVTHLGLFPARLNDDESRPKKSNSMTNEEVDWKDGRNEEENRSIEGA